MAEVVSEEDILNLIAQREQARQSKDYASSDALRETLRAMGVEVLDKEKMWKASDGRSGVLFTAGPRECTLDTADIKARIAEREQARTNKEWARSDQLREEMRILGIELNDREAMWRTNAGRAGTYSGHDMQPGSHVSGKGGGKGKNSAIEHLIAERERFRDAKDYASADNVRNQLSKMGVEILDQEKMWRAKDGRQGLIVTGGHQGKCHLHSRDIISKISQREHARTAKDWDKADQIRDELRKAGVELLDKHHSWATSDGREGHFPGHGPGGGGGGGGGMDGGYGGGYAGGYGGDGGFDGGWGEPAPDEMYGMAQMISSGKALVILSNESIKALLEGRERARERHDWGTSDAIRDDLRQAGVELWDKEKSWQAADGRGGYMPRPH